MTDTTEKKVSKGKKETFMQGIITLIFSQLKKLLCRGLLH